jgi:hypothetical protein
MKLNNAPRGGELSLKPWKMDLPRLLARAKIPELAEGYSSNAERQPSYISQTSRRSSVSV